uniref:Uncharacterized protein n=1 Tax=Tanacetum cinerariifolium TaxID=118510 RepID=A0A699T5E2_TANCI|nr:hypothetical protein [Tanacetum cinerariifolium]
MEDQPLPTDASPTALSPEYVVTIMPIEEIIRMMNHLNDDDNDDDVEKDEEDKEEEEHLAPADSSDVSTDDLVPSS